MASANQDRWEHGSEFDWPNLPSPLPPVRYPWTDRAHSLYGSGRDALQALLQHGAQTRGWRRLWMPSYLCQEVVSTAASNLPIEIYLDDPTSSHWTLPVELRDGDAVFVVNTFALRRPPTARVDADLIEDHSHDLLSRWAFESHAQFALASLRKTLPLPDGGLVWSPAGESIPSAPPATAQRLAASANKTTAMLLKRYYLDGHAVAKDEFRQLSAEGEKHIAGGETSGASPLSTSVLPILPISRWREVRERNGRAFREALGKLPWVEMLEWPRTEPGFALTLLTDTSARRESLRRHLIEHRIYPAVLWSLEEPITSLPPASVDLSRRILSLHCDHRYSVTDLERVAQVVRNLP